jgi:rSAM/selenodomain-associated transferase 1
MNALLVIAKRPSAGQTKTRLTPPLRPADAARLYECFLRDTLDIARAVPGARRFIYYAPAEAAGYFATLAPDFERLPQAGAGLGERLDHGLARCLAAGFERVVVMDSDSPTLPAAYVAQAFEALRVSDVVLGPSDDGGYYLIGATRPQPRLVREVEMSQPNLLADTLTLAAQMGLRTALLPAWYDVDTVQEFMRLQAELAAGGEALAPHTAALLVALAPARMP